MKAHKFYKFLIQERQTFFFFNLWFFFFRHTHKIRKRISKVFFFYFRVEKRALKGLKGPPFYTTISVIEFCVITTGNIAVIQQKEAVKGQRMIWLAHKLGISPVFINIFKCYLLFALYLIFT